MPSDVEKSHDFRDGMPFLGGSSWLDLANSSFKLDGNAFDFLADDDSFAAWVAAAGFEINPAALAQERLAALELRGLVRAVLDELDKSGTPTPDQVNQINQLLTKRTISERLARSSDGLGLQTLETVASPQIAALLASDLAHFLSGYEPHRLKSCDNPACAMVFYDRGRNNRRRWCTMSICGNRDKVTNYRARKAGVKAH